jgi:uncharacterized protein
MPTGSESVFVVCILFAATLVRSAFGFGEALLAVPLLALLMPIETAAPIAVLVSITVAAIIALQDWRKIHVRSAAWLIFPTLPGIPLGLLLLTAVPSPVVKSLLAAVILAFSGYSLLSSRRGELKDDRLAWIFGFTAGVLGGAYGMNGPPLVLYGSLRRWQPQYFRATLQAYFLPASLAGLWGYKVAGLWTSTVDRHYLISLPFVILATLLGRVINRRMDSGRFLIYVHGALIVIACGLLLQSLAG